MTREQYDAVCLDIDLHAIDVERTQANNLHECFFVLATPNFFKYTEDGSQLKIIVYENDSGDAPVYRYQYQTETSLYYMDDLSAAELKAKLRDYCK